MKSPHLFKLVAINIGKFIFLTGASVVIFVLTSISGQQALIYFTHCPADCVIETFSSMLIFGVIVGLGYLYFLIKGIKNFYITIRESN